MRMMTARLFARLIKESELAAKLSLIGIEKDGCVKVGSTGDLTVLDLHPLDKNPLEAVLGAQWAEGRVLLDLHQTKFIDSAVIGWLISSQREFRGKGGVLAVHSIEPRVRRILDLLKVGQMVNLFDNETAARRFALKPAA